MRQEKLVEKARTMISNDDPSHDRSHCQRVWNNCQAIVKEEGGDLDILLPAALLHDVVNHPKNDPRSEFSSDESAEVTSELLREFPDYPQEKIPAVAYAIKQCSYSKNLPHDTHESQILQDADYLESVGAISLMRTFCSGGQMKKAFFHPTDPRCEQREPENKAYSFDLILGRLIHVHDRMLTKTGRTLGKQRHDFLYTFMEQVKKEYNGME